MSAGQCSRRGPQNDHAGRFDLLAWRKLAASLFPGSVYYEEFRSSRCWRGFTESSRRIGPAHIDRGRLAKIARAAAMQSLIPLASLDAINSAAQGGMTMAVDSMAIRQATGIGTAAALTTFSAIVHNNSADRCKLFLRLGIGDGAFPESAKSARKRHLAVRLAAGDAPLKRHGQSATSEPKGLRTESRKRDERTHRRVGSRIENATNEPTGDGVESRKRDERTHRPT